MSEAATIEQAASQGVASLFSISPIVTILVLIIIGLGWMTWYLVQRNQALNDKMTDAFVANTAVVAEFKEMIRAIVNQKN